VRLVQKLHLVVLGVRVRGSVCERWVADVRFSSEIEPVLQSLKCSMAPNSRSALRDVEFGGDHFERKLVDDSELNDGLISLLR